ncbi:transcriptional regulator [Vibrio sp.]|uniref:transcriptional regulator n=1 Tax=Vibrio sp. TaxID=678 RepID=UPI003D0C88A7
MDDLSHWLLAVEQCLQSRKHDQVDQLYALIIDPPSQIWHSPLTSQTSKALAWWLEGCVRVFEHQAGQRPVRAFNALSLAITQLQTLPGDEDADNRVRLWSLKQLQPLVVIAIEFCHHQNGDKWQTLKEQTIQQHVNFMLAIENQSQGLHQQIQ